MKRKSLCWLRLASTFIDISLVYSISICLRPLIWKFIYIDLDKIFVGVFLLYYLIDYLLLKGRTPAKILTGLRVIQTNGNDCRPYHFILRESVSKTIIGIFLPVYILTSMFHWWSAIFTIALILLILFLSFLIMLLLNACTLNTLNMS